ncbi:MAG: iron-sulfur cluster assembly scaffold protein [Candidatus Diapherotrites archaeon]|nr:iron-sulfur cluster assembly scaffold protein [Candidatus Diapherotrites archaeon]
MTHNSVYLAHSQHPQNIGSIKDPTNIAEIKFEEAGKDAQISVYCNNKDNTIQEIKYIVKASIPVVASLSYLSVLLKGKKIPSAFELTETDIVKALELPVQYHYCASRALEAIHKALRESEDPFDKAFRSISAYNAAYDPKQALGEED